MSPACPLHRSALLLPGLTPGIRRCACDRLMARRDALSAEEMREEYRRLCGPTAASHVALAPAPTERPKRQHLLQIESTVQ
jgi:hypothetical protein